MHDSIAEGIRTTTINQSDVDAALRECCSSQGEWWTMGTCSAYEEAEKGQEEVQATEWFVIGMCVWTNLIVPCNRNYPVLTG